MSRSGRYQDCSFRTGPRLFKRPHLMLALESTGATHKSIAASISSRMISRGVSFLSDEKPVEAVVVARVAVPIDAVIKPMKPKRTEEQKRERAAEVFWARVDRSGDCWLWKGFVNANGYGRVKVGPKKKQMLAHRQAWVVTHGNVPDDLCVCHKCDVRLCVNPDHLFLGTRIDNNRDMYEKMRKRETALIEARLAKRRVVTDVPPP